MRSYMDHAQLRIPPPLPQTDNDSGGSTAITVMSIAGGTEAASAADLGRLADLQSQLARSIHTSACNGMENDHSISIKDMWRSLPWRVPNGRSSTYRRPPQWRTPLRSLGVSQFFLFCPKMAAYVKS